jgi:hypothetical protein
LTSFWKGLKGKSLKKRRPRRKRIKGKSLKCRIEADEKK